MIGARSLHIIEQSGRHLAAVISDMLDLSRIQSGTLDLHLGVCAAGDLGVASIAALREEAQRKQQQVDFIINPPDLQVRARRAPLRAGAREFACQCHKVHPAGGKLGLTIGVSGTRLHSPYGTRASASSPTLLHSCFDRLRRPMSGYRAPTAAPVWAWR